MFRDALRRYLHKLNDIYLQNWWGRIWLMAMIASVSFVVYCANLSINNRYIPYALFFSFWFFIVLILVRFTEFSLKKRFAILLIAFIFNFCIGIGLMLISYDETEQSEAKFKIGKGYEKVCEIAGGYPGQSSENVKKFIEDYFGKDRYNNLVGKIHIRITKGNELLYEKNFNAGVAEKYNIERKDICLLNHVRILYEYAGTPNVPQWWLRTLSFFAYSSPGERGTFITAKTYKHSLGFLFTFIILTHCCIYIAYVDCENTTIKEALEEKNRRIEAQREELEAQNEELQENRLNLEERNRKIEAQREELEAQNEELQENKRQLEDRNSQIEHKNEELQKNNDKLHRFELVYNRMMADVKKTAKYDPMQSLQVMAFGWRDFVNTQIRSGRHSLRNSVTGRAASKEDLKAFEDELYATVINPTVEQIVSHLNKTVDMIDTAPSRVTTKKIYEEICKHIDGKYFTSKAERKHIFLHTKYAVEGPYVCDVNLYRLKAIIENLCFNTRQAFFKKRDELEDTGEDEAFDTFDVSVGLTFSIVKEDDGEFLYMDYRDNAVGFPDELLPKIYRSPVPSAKDGERKGEGTMYISFFVEDMKGRVEAESQMDENGRKFAVTKIYIPVKVGTEEV